MPKNINDFESDVGGFLDDIDGKITAAIFAVAAGEYADKVLTGGPDAKPPVVLTLIVESPDLEKLASQNYSVGSQDLWEIVDTGQKIQHVKNSDLHAFRKGSRASSLVEAILVSVGADGKELKDPGEIALALRRGQEWAIKRDIYMADSRFYIGLNFHWTSQKLATVAGGTSSAPLPSKFLSEGQVSSSPKANVPSSGPIVLSDLDKIIVDNASGKTEQQLKSFAVRNDVLKQKSNESYLRLIVNGSRLRELENTGNLTLDPIGKTYL